jgi:three-Cys-motif partner protein
MGQTKNFFKEKKSWSVVKDRILDYYLAPYTSKILRTGKPIVFCDCFAGKGKFDDGEIGSPLIIAEHIRSVNKLNSEAKGKISALCIEKKYHDDLKKNLVGYDGVYVRPGAFEDNLSHILSQNKQANLFLYIDPYGVKSLNLAFLDQIKSNGFSSLEMLMNFNSAGFLREGCRLLKFDELFKEEDIPDYEADEDANTKENMDAVAGGNYWQEILADFYRGKISMHEAEERFFDQYSQVVKKRFKYTVNIPIKIKSHHLPKYRLIFGSDHEDGLVLMADNMNKKWTEIVAIARGGQQALFDYEFPDLSLLKGFDLFADILRLVAMKPSGMPLRSLIVGLIQKYGISFSESQYKKSIRQLEEKGMLLIDRVPARTPKGKPAVSMDYGEYRITVRPKI